MKTVYSGQVYILLPVLMLMLIISCSKKPGDVLEEMKDSRNKDNYEDVNNYYTKGTLKAFKELDKLSSGGKDKSEYIDKKFIKGTDWEILEEKIEGNDAEVKIKYTEHPIENMKGLELTFRFSKEDGDWKIDMQKELEISIKMLKMAENMQSNDRKSLLNEINEYMKSKK